MITLKSSSAVFVLLSRVWHGPKNFLWDRATVFES